MGDISKDDDVETNVQPSNTHDFEIHPAEPTSYTTVPDHYQKVDDNSVSSSGIYHAHTDGDVSSTVDGKSQVTEYDTTLSEIPEPVIDHTLTGQQPWQAETTEYFSTSEFGVLNEFYRERTEYDVDGKESPEPTIDHNLTDQQPSLAETTECNIICGHSIQYSTYEMIKEGDAEIETHSSAPENTIDEKRNPEPTIDHSLTGQQPHQAETTDYNIIYGHSDQYSRYEMIKEDATDHKRNSTLITNNIDERQNPEPTIDHRFTGQQPNHSETTDYNISYGFSNQHSAYEIIKDDVSDKARNCPSIEHDVSEKEYTEPTIDHSLTGHQPYLANTTEYNISYESYNQHSVYETIKDDVPDFERNSPASENDIDQKEVMEPTLDHSLTGQQPYQADVTEYVTSEMCNQNSTYEVIKEEVFDMEGKSPTTQYDIDQKEDIEPTIDHSLTGQEPYLANTTEYITSECDDQHSTYEDINDDFPEI